MSFLTRSFPSEQCSVNEWVLMQRARGLHGGDIYGFPHHRLRLSHKSLHCAWWSKQDVWFLSLYAHLCVCVKSCIFPYMYRETEWITACDEKRHPHTHTPIVHFIAATKQGRPVTAKKKDNEVTDDVLRYVRMHNELYKYVPCQASYFYTQIRSCVHKMAF